MALSIMAMIVYFWALFLSPPDITLGRFSISEWAILIPVFIFVYLFLIVIAWIGWAMITTPPTLPSQEESIIDRGNSQRFNPRKWKG
ncbi:MAG: hypothetical protein QW502_02925 [Candidatus Bathyarchaeia archaeon]